ncbi:type 1 glutamine amidotransferase (plasmid) [Burkholderia vietnamiensis]|uniref:Glutamine amidotransferase class-I n=1 Tax=Burkholderia vietnamiensis (strain G4 / LMG 22486) TaxID=269482 RepID=A4JTR9_BURVG|nr:glutamine amidotransferase class-I [Burkholderia vietnamiensis G4]MCB4350170.1 type 1 glutamine amidotransferase [Burkholderia vietnamiensis]
MRIPHLAVVEGNTAETRQLQLAAGGSAYSASYADVLQNLRDVKVDIIYPTDEGELPSVDALGNLDGVVLTGSWLNIYNGGEAIDRQVELMRRVFQSGTPFFGSCWGLQVATVAAGGTVRRNPRGREVGVAEPLRKTEAGQDHPLLRGKPDPYMALTVHLDEVESVAPGMTVLAGNSWSAVQAAEFSSGDSVGWAVQYHPEFSLRNIAGFVRRYGADLIAQGTLKDEASVEQKAKSLELCESAATGASAAETLNLDDTVLSSASRTRELTNWFDFLVLPTMTRRGRP